MTQHDPWQFLTQHYDGHDVNEAAILEQLRDHSVSLDTLSEDVLKDYDMDHFGGTEAIESLAQKAGIDARSYVLDVGSGLGGPARYLAHRYGCRVMGLDITESRIQGALRFTRMVKLDHLVDFRVGNALAMPLADHTFDVVIGQEAWMHIADKARLLDECARVLTLGGRMAFTDFLRNSTMQPTDLARVKQHYWLPGEFFAPETLEGYSQLLAEAGFTLVEREDLSTSWAGFLVQRAESLRRRRHEIVQQFGEEHYRQRMERRQILDEMYAAGKMGGGRFIARREAPKKT
jgi:cyclopropane fatty-acyl-phospholipid synthase-like methyltransferase